MKISGEIIRGRGKGRRLGFPTINIILDKKIEGGVYAGIARTGGKKYKTGIFINPDKQLLEAHLIGFCGDLYGREIEIEIGEKVRDVMKFDGDEKLKKQIKRDVDAIRNL